MPHWLSGSCDLLAHHNELNVVSSLPISYTFQEHTASGRTAVKLAKSVLALLNTVGQKKEVTGLGLW